jgi:hypothetical protein
LLLADDLAKMMMMGLYIALIPTKKKMMMMGLYIALIPTQPRA